MTEDEIYNTKFLDEISGYDRIRREDVAAEQDFRAVQKAEWAAQDRALNEMLEGWVDERGRPVPGFEPVPVEGVDTTTKEGFNAMVRSRRDLELGRISGEMHKKITAALRPATENVVRGRS